MNRRGFLRALGGAGAVLVAPAIVRASSLMPVHPIAPRLWGDGVHDDTAALQWLIDARKVIPKGKYLTSKSLDVFPGKLLSMWDSIILTQHKDPAIVIHEVPLGAPVADLDVANTSITLLEETSWPSPHTTHTTSIRESL